MRARKVPKENNAQAASIILSDPYRYVGLPAIWADAWVKQHGAARKPAKQAGHVERRDNLVRK
jgi:hypothetical protein